MNIYYAEHLESELNPKDVIRPHPWEDSEYSNEVRYYDFIKNPELIETSLEDFLPHSTYQAIQTFYDFLRWTNGKESMFETNDCAFMVGKNKDKKVSQKISKQKFCCRGRVLIFYRQHILNGSENAFKFFAQTLWGKLKSIDPSFDLGCIKFVEAKTVYINLPYPLSKSESPFLGLYFWAWGMTEEESMKNLDRLFNNLFLCTKETSNYILSKTNLKDEGDNALKIYKQKMILGK